MTPDPQVEHRSHYALTFAVLMLACLAYSLLQSMILPALPVFEREFNISQNDASWLVIVYLLSASVATPIIGRLGDAHGMKKLLCIVLFVLGVGSVLSALATHYPLMLVGRTLQGSAGALFPLGFGIVRDEFPEKLVVTGIGLISAMMGFGSGLGLILAGPILQHLSYHWLFWVPAIITAIALVAALVVIPESRVRSAGGINWLGGVLLALWLIALLLGISKAPSWGWTSTKVWTLFFIAAVLAVLWVLSESRSASPLVDMKMMRIPTVWRTNVSAVLFGFGMFTLMVTVPAFVETSPRYGYGFGASISQAGLFLLPMMLGQLFGAPLCGRIASVVGSKLPLVAGGLLTAAGYVVFLAAHSHSWSIYLGIALCGLGIGFAYTSMANLVVEAVAREQTGVATGMNANLRTIGGAAGSAVAASLVVSSVFANGVPKLHGYLLAFLGSASALIVASLVALSISEHRPAADPEEHSILASEAGAFTGVAILREE